MPVTQVISALPDAPHRGVDTADVFVTKGENLFDALHDTTVGQLNTAFGQLNTLETNVNAKEVLATNAASAALASENAAELAESNANASEIAAAASAASAAAILDNFDDRYLGSKASAPTLDNDGNPLTSGALYFNTTSDTMFVYDLELTQWIALTFTPTDHGSLTGLGDDDHAQYHNDARGDARYLQLSGGPLTGGVTSLRETSVAMGALAIDCATGNIFTKTISGASTLTVSNVPSTGQAYSFVLKLTNGGSATVTWFASVKWAGGTAPTLTASGVDAIGFITHDGGTTWYGFKMGLDLK